MTVWEQALLGFVGMWVLQGICRLFKGTPLRDASATLLSRHDRINADEEWCRRHGVRYDPNNRFAYVDDIVERLLR